MSKNNEDKSLLLISVKPQFAEKILTGEKTIELRKSAPKKAGNGSIILIYVTSPIKELWGIGKIENIIKTSPKSLWDNYRQRTGVTKHEFQSYYENSSKAFGIELTNVKRILNQSITLNMLKEILPEFMPPQTYAYIDIDDVNYSNMKKLILLSLKDKPVANRVDGSAAK